MLDHLNEKEYPTPIANHHIENIQNNRALEIVLKLCMSDVPSPVWCTEQTELLSIPASKCEVWRNLTSIPITTFYW